MVLMIYTNDTTQLYNIVIDEGQKNEFSFLFNSQVMETVQSVCGGGFHPTSPFERCMDI